MADADHHRAVIPDQKEQCLASGRLREDGVQSGRGLDGSLLIAEAHVHGNPPKVVA
jgi:hypothetical protein